MDFFDVVAAEHRGTQIPGNTTIWMIAFGATDSNDAFAVSFMAPCSTAFAFFSSAAHVQEKKCLSRRDGKQFVEHFVFVLGWTSRHHYGATVGNRCEGKEHVVCMFDSIECCLGGIDVSPFTSIRRNIHNGVLAVIAGCLIFFCWLLPKENSILYHINGSCDTTFEQCSGYYVFLMSLLVN